MPVEHLSDAFVEINSVDLSDHVKSVELSYEAEMLDRTAMGKTTRDNMPGLLNWGLSVTFFQDFDAGEVDATMFSLVGAAAFTVKVKRKNTTTSATNPEYSGGAVVESYPPISGEVGGEHLVQVSFKPGGASNTLARATS